MNVLIVTEPDDIHAALVKLALEIKGIECDLLFSADMPSKQRNNVYISDKNWSWNTIENESNTPFYYNQFDAIWWRRPRRPFVPDYVHEDDKIFIHKENSIYHDSIPYLLNDGAWWVNPIASQPKTRSKIVQLKLAQRCGFKLPKTLISNSPQDIKEFINHSNRKVIYKPFHPQCWADHDGLKIIYTDKVTTDDLPSDEMLQIVPGIYQNYVEKKYELRVTCFGSYISAVKIDSQADDLGKTDWRRIPGNELPLVEVELPQTVKNRIILLMKELGIVFGCFDFIVTPNDELVFLEVNEQGQFLWVEELLPELCYLDVFCEFLINKHFNFNWYPTGRTLHSSDLDTGAQKIIDEQMKHHVYLNSVKKAA